jgi:hypothetical protein
VLLGLKGNNSEGASANVIMGEKELRRGTKTHSIRCHNRYLYFLPADLGGAALLSLLKGMNNYERG